VSFAIHPSFYHEEAVLGGFTSGPLKIAAKDFCLCKGCKLPALRVCLGEVEGGIHSHVYSSGLEVHFFVCDGCTALTSGDVRPKCACCDDGSGLLRKSTNGYWVHYTCALLTTKVKILSLADMKFEFKEEFDINKLEQKKTRSKKAQEGPGIHTVLRNQAQLIVAGEKEADDHDFTLIRFMLQSRDDRRPAEIEKKQLIENINSNIEFGAPLQNQKKTTKKKKVVTDAVNATVLLGIETKEEFLQQVEDHWKVESNHFIQNEVQDRYQLQILLPNDNGRSANYCNCFQTKEMENFISCDECQVWYHCGCVGVCLETLTANDSFICQKCKKFKELENKKPILFQDLEPLKKERLNFDEIINLGVLIESAIIESASPADIFAMDFSCFDISSIISTRLCDFALNCFLVSRTTALLQQINLTRVYKEGSIDSEEFIKLRTLVHGSRAVALSVSSTDKMPEYVSFNELLETIELGTQLYEELRARVLRLPILVSIAKKVESHPELRTLEAHQTFIAALKIAKSKLDLILADFREFSKSLDGKIKEDNVEGVQNCKLQNSRLAEYRKDLMDNHLALRVVEALLSDLGLSEADKHSEIPLKLDHFLVILKKELKSIFRSGESDVVRVWQEKRGLFEKSKVIMHKIQKLKTELPQWKEIAELDTPEAVVATRTEVDRILEESEDSVLVMNSAIVKKLSDLKVASIKFEKRNVGDHWNSSESSKRYVFNLIKSGVLFNDEAVKLVKELKLYGQIVRFCNNRGMFSIAEIEAQLATGERKFEKDFYIKADLLAEEIKVFLNKASQLQDRKDVWNDRVLEECLQVHKKLKDYRIKLPSTLNKFASICKSVNWLMDIAEQCGLETEIEKPGALLRYPFETTVQKLNLTDSLIDNLNIRTLVRLEKTHPPGVFLHHPNLFVLSSKTAKRVWQKDFEEVIAVGWPIHVEDFKHLLKKWAVMDPELSTVPKEMRILLDEYIEFRNSCQKLVHNEIDLFPLEMDKMEKTCVDLSRITGLNKVACLENTFDNLQRCAVMFLNFALKTQKVLLYTEQSTGGRKPAEGSQIESSEIVMLENLMNHVLKNIQREMPLELASQTWLSQFLHLAKIFSQKVQQGEKISALVEGLQKRSEVVLQRISALRKEKNISLGAIMEEIKGKPTVEEAKDILKKYQAFSSTVDDKRGLIERSIEDSYTLVETMNRLISETKISMSGDDENKTKFQSYEKEFLRLLKKSENLLVYSPTFTICIQAANTLYKIYKLYFEPATMKKWSKVNDSIKETFSQFQEVEEVVKKTGVLDSFTSQLSVISQLTDRLVKEKVSLEDVRAMEVLCDSCLVDKIGNVEIHKLLSDCQSLNSILDQVKEAGPSKKVGLDVMENCRLQIDNFDLVIDDQEVDFLLKAVDSHKSLLKFLQGAQKEGFLMNGFLTDFIEKRYTSSPIYSKPIEDLLTARQNALNQYDNVENTIKRLADDSYREAEAKLTSIKPTWEIRNKKLMLLAWLRKAKAIHDNKLPVNLVALECLVAEGAEFFERSKKLIPKDQRIISICLVNKIGYLEELLLMADAFLEDLSKSRSVGELDELKNKFKEHGRIDLSSTIIDMRTQLSFGSIEFTKQRRQANVPAIRDSIGQITTGEVGWDIDRDYRNVEELFNRLIQHDRNTLETRFIEMLDSGHFSLYREPFQLSLEGSLGNKDDQMLGKRKPVVKPNYSTHTASIPKNLALISKPGDEIAGPLVNTHSIANLSNLQVDLETITDSFRENVISNLFICLKENTHFETDHSILNNGAKNMEMHLFSEEHKSKSGYTKAYLFLRGLISRLSNYEAISRDLAKNSFNYDYIMQFREKSDQRLLAFERELKALVDSKYNPLGSLAKDTKIGATSRSQKPPGAAGKNRLLEVAGDKSLLSDVYFLLFRFFNNLKLKK
jgi:hypothetical protein